MRSAGAKAADVRRSKNAHHRIPSWQNAYQTPTSKFRARDKLDAAEVIMMYAEMHTTKEIAQRFGVCSKVVIKCLRENGIKIRNRWDYAKK